MRHGLGSAAAHRWRRRHAVHANFGQRKVVVPQGRARCFVPSQDAEVLVHLWRLIRGHREYPRRVASRVVLHLGVAPASQRSLVPAEDGPGNRVRLRFVVALQKGSARNDAVPVSDEIKLVDESLKTSDILRISNSCGVQHLFLQGDEIVFSFGLGSAIAAITTTQ